MWRQITGLSGSPNGAPISRLCPGNGIVSEGIRDLHGLTMVGGVIDVHGNGAAENVAVVAPHQHFFPVHVPGVNTIKRMKIPARSIWVARRVRQVIVAVAVLHDDLFVRLEIIGAQIEFRSRGEEDVTVIQNATERDVVGIGESRTVRPGLSVVFGQKDLSAAKTDGLVIALRINVGTVRR